MSGSIRKYDVISQFELAVVQVEALQYFNMDCNDLLEFAKEEPSDPFLHTVAPFPVYRTALQPPSFQDTAAERPSHIPEHFPAFPAAHTCVHFCGMNIVSRAHSEAACYTTSPAASVPVMLC